MPDQKFQVFKLTFESGLHLAKGKNVYDESDTILHSDTLKAALFVNALQLYGAEKINAAFLDSFTISSAFPFYKDEFFFPKPYTQIQQFENVDEGQQPKKLKKIAFLGKSYFEDLLNGGEKKLNPDHLLEGGSFISDDASVNQQASIYQSDIQQRVFIPRNYTDDTVPYYVDRLFFSKEAGLFFILHTTDEKTLDIIQGALRLLGDHGIGTDRSVGNGHFSFEEEEINVQLPEAPDRQVLLSLYCPERQEINEENLHQSSYQLIKRGGYLASAEDVSNITLRKRSIYMFGEGSVFPIQAKLKGKLVDLKPEITTVKHPVWRDGRAFFLPMKSLNT